MKNLNSLQINSRNTEVDAVSGRIINEYNKGNWSSDVHLTGVITLLVQKSGKLTRAINRIKAESDLEIKDEERDNGVRAVYYLIAGFIHHPDLAISVAAKKVDAVFDHYGLDIVKENFATESSLIESLLEDLSVTELQTAIAAVPGLSRMVDNLRTAQATFEDALLLFQEEKAKEGEEENATEIKKEVLSIINEKLVVYLNAMIQVNETKYGEFAVTVAQIIDDMNVTVKKRKKNPEPGNATAAPAKPGA